jgi:hypothetical protein
VLAVVWGALSPSLSLIAAGSCERSGGSGGAKRPRSKAAGALDAFARERIIAGGRAGMPGGWGCQRSGAAAFCAGVTVSGDGREPGRGQPALPWPAGLAVAPVT